MNLKDKQKIQNHIQVYCSNCVKRLEDKCTVFKEDFHWWNPLDEECWAKESDPAKYLEHMKVLEDYNLRVGGAHLNKQLKEELHRMETLARAQAYEGLKEVYMEDLKRGQGGGGGEKADRTNKTFGPQQMKDNRFPHRKNNPRKWSGWY